MRPDERYLTVVHAYFAVDWSTIWQTAIQDVPALASKVAPILGRSLEDP